MNIELGKTNRLKALCMMQIKNDINKLCVNKQRQSMKIKSILQKSMAKKEALYKQTTLVKAANSISKQALYTALYTTALKLADNHA